MYNYIVAPETYIGHMHATVSLYQTRLRCTPCAPQHARGSEPDRLFQVLNSCLQLYKGVSLAANVLLVQVLGLKHPHLQNSLVPAYGLQILNI